MQDAGEAVDVLLQHVQKSLHETDQVHRDRDGVGQREHQADGSAEFRAYEKVRLYGVSMNLAVVVVRGLVVVWLSASSLNPSGD